jgi:hypothetical protein
MFFGLAKAVMFLVAGAIAEPGTWRAILIGFVLFYGVSVAAFAGFEN